MLDNWISAIKIRSTRLNETLRLKVRQIVSSFEESNNNKKKKNASADGRVKVQPSTPSVKSPSLSVENLDYADYLAPRAYSMTTPTITDVHWLPHMANTYDEHNIVDKFTRIITLDNHVNNRHADREEIRRRLAAMGADDTDSANTDDLSSYTKWSQTQRHWKFGAGAGRSGSGSSAGTGGGMHMQICFMNNTICDSDDVAPNSTTSASSSYCGSDLEIAAVAPCLPQKCCEFETRQARLQIEARMALAQAKQMARAEMCAERQKRQRDASTHSPIAQMVRDSLARVGVSATTTGQQQIRRFSRQLLTDMNVAQLQVIVNDLHGRIETLNEALVGMLMKRDDLHMEQDSMLVDIEDLTRYFDAKEQSRKSTGSSQTSLTNPFKFIGNSPKTTGRNVKTDNSASTSIKPHFHRFGSLIAN